MGSRSTRFRRMAAGCLAALALSACGVFQPPGSLPPGTPIAEARRWIGGPTGEYALPGGGTRLEFAQGGFAKATYMLDFDATGHLVSSRQVLTEADFAAIKPGMTGAEVLMRIGHPTWVFGVGRQHLTVWNYRFAAPLGCVVFQVSVSDAGLVTDAAQGYDPACDGPPSNRD